MFYAHEYDRAIKFVRFASFLLFCMMACYKITKTIKKCQLSLSLDIVSIELNWNIIMVAKWKRWSTVSGGIKSRFPNTHYFVYEKEL